MVPSGSRGSGSVFKEASRGGWVIVRLGPGAMTSLRDGSHAPTADFCSLAIRSILNDPLTPSQTLRTSS